MIWRYSRKGLQFSPKSDTLIFFSKSAITTFLVFGLKLVLNMTFDLNENYFSEKFEIWRYLTSKSSKIAQIEVFRHFLDFPSLGFFDFAHYDRWARCLVVFLPFAGPINVFLLIMKYSHSGSIRLSKVLMYPYVSTNAFKITYWSMVTIFVFIFWNSI